MSAVAEAAPRWDLSPFFPSLNSTEFVTAFEGIAREIDRLEELFDREAIEGSASTQAARIFEAVAEAWNQLQERSRLVGAYLYALVTTDSRDEDAQARLSQLQAQSARMHKLAARMTAWVGAQDLEAMIAASPVAADHEFALRKMAVESRHLMSPAEEDLAADLMLTGSTAWSKLHGNFTSQITVSVAVPEGPRDMPMSAVRALAYDPDAAVRRAAFEAEIEAWRSTETVLAACMNGVKGEQHELARRRGWGSPLDEAIFNANIDRPTLEAMLDSARDSFPAFRRYLHAKARSLGHTGGLPFCDLFAPLGGDRAWAYDEATTFVERHFRGYSDKMGDFAQRAFNENWIDVPPVPGKRDGAYCMGVRGDESRILMNYKPAFGSVSTLAHELGHGYHNLCLASRSAMQRRTPMTLAETASIFCETIIKQAALQEGTDQEKLGILEATLMGACQVVVDITSRYLFESRVLDLRSQRELSARELGEIMQQAQRETYGDGLSELHPYMWAAKPHYYGRAFYNFPYMFGLLFGLGLYARYKADPDGFRAAYDDLLASTGLADAAELGARFGIDVRSAAFWQGSLSVIEQDIDRYERLIGR